MDVNLPLDKMTVAEKLRAIEEIWNDLCRTPEKIPSPGWHEDVLRAREQRAAEGKTTIQDWTEAKQAIRDSIK